MKRLVTVVQTQGNNFSVESGASLWGELRPELESKGASFDNKTVLISGLNLTISHNEAQLPAGNFVIIVAPAKFKAAAMGYKELKAQLKEWYANYPGVRTIIGDYTHSSTVELQRKYDAAHSALKAGSTTTETPLDAPTLEQRMLAVEIQLQMRNDANAEAFDAHFTEKYAAIK